jgi:hypothetical protein
MAVLHLPINFLTIMKVQIFLALLLALAVSRVSHKHVSISSGERADFPAADLDALIRSSG